MSFSCNCIKSALKQVARLANCYMLNLPLIPLNYFTFTNRYTPILIINLWQFSHFIILTTIFTHIQVSKCYNVKYGLTIYY